MPKVIIWRDGAIETEFDPGHRDWRMGRSETNDITLLDPRKSVSRFHAELREENGRWVFIDLNSQNGSWKDGQRVNRLVLEHGHEVLFGDYKLTFEDVRVAAPPPPALPSTADVTMDVHAATADVPIPPDQTLLLPGKVQPAAPAPPGSGSAPVLRAPVKPKPPRKGINPLILVLFLIAMLGAAAAVAWKVLSSDPAGPRVADGREATPPETVPEPAPADPAPADPAVPPIAPSIAGAPDPSLAATPGAAPGTATPSAATGLPPAAASPAAPPAAPAAASPGVAAAAPTAGAATPPAPRPAGTPRPRRAPTPAAPKDNPAVVTRYEDGRRALAAGRFAEAERAFAAVLAQQPDFRDTTALLAQARGGQTAAREASLAEARALEASGDWPRAIAAYERAGASDGADGARTKMTAAGDDAYRKARQFDARNRPIDAIAWYQRAATWLPDSDPRKAAAQERLAALKGGGE